MIAALDIGEYGYLQREIPYCGRVIEMLGKFLALVIILI